jgi:hypothetical protein
VGWADEEDLPQTGDAHDRRIVEIRHAGRIYLAAAES